MIEIIKLHFKTPLHLGRGSEELDKSEVVYHSDSLKSAIFAVGCSHYPSWIKDHERFFSSFRISSCFPFSADELFLPKPRINRKYKFTKTPEDFSIKKSKRIEFLSLPPFIEFIKNTNEPFLVDDDLLTPDGAFLCKSKRTFTRIDPKQNEVPFNFYRTEVQQRVRVALEGEQEETKPYYIDRLHFDENCGLYFLVEFNDDTLRSQVMHVLQLLGDLGIGTDKTVGNGLFDITEAGNLPQEFPGIPDEPRRWINLGLYLPDRQELEEIDLDESQWGLIKRGGYLAGSETEELSHLRKKSIYMFTEGSIFNSPTKLKGKLVDLKPDYNDPRMHNVWRDGQCLMINI